MYSPILVPDKNTCELKTHGNPTTKKFNFFTVFGLFMFQQKTLEK